MKHLLLITLTFVMFSFTSPNNANEKVSGNSGLSAETTGVNVGDRAPSFKLKSVDGKVYSFANIDDGNGNKPKGYIVVFTCNTCPVSKANEQRLINLHKKYAPLGYPVVAIQPNSPKVNAGESYEAMQKNAKEKGFPFLYLFDEQQSVFPKYGATKTPEVYLVDRNLIVRYHGAIDDSARDEDDVSEKFLENAIYSIDKGEDPKPANTKAIGCGIKSA
jgi:peroxiredoxin